MVGRVLVLGLVLVGALVLPARATPLGQAGSATLSVLAGRVDVQTPGAAAFAPGSDGQTLAIGARVRTGIDGRALLTFFDGTTAALDSGTELALERVDPSAAQPGGLVVGVGLSVGRVWAQVSSLFDRGSSFEVRAAGATAVAREGTTGFRLDPDGTLTCWTITGQPMKIRTAGGEIEVAAMEQVTLSPGQTVAAPRPRNFRPGRLEVHTAGNVLAWLVDPSELSVGFVLDDLVVNQILDASTNSPRESERRIHLPGPLPGLYRLVLRPTDQGGPYRVRVLLELEGRELFAREWSATGRPGEQLLADLTVAVRDGVPTGAQLGDPRPLVGQPPGNFVYP